jgi:molecular chaperone GrpE (heat shock protein)
MTKTPTPSPNPFDLALVATVETLETQLVDLAEIARKILARIEQDSRRYADPVKHAATARLQSLLGDLVASLPQP